MSDVVAPEKHHNDRRYVHELSGPIGLLSIQFSMVGGYTEDHKTQNSKLGAGRFIAQMMVVVFQFSGRAHIEVDTRSSLFSAVVSKQHLCTL